MNKMTTALIFSSLPRAPCYQNILPLAFQMVLIWVRKYLRLSGLVLFGNTRAEFFFIDKAMRQQLKVNSSLSIRLLMDT